MYPTVFGLRSYSLALFLAVLLGTITSIVGARYTGVPLRKFLWANYLLLILGLGCARLYAGLEARDIPSSAAEVFFPALRLPGGIIGLAGGGAILLWREGRHFALTMLDIVAPATCVALAVLRVGCFLNGCCTGSVCHLPWAISFPAPSLAWRTQVSAGLVESHTPTSLAVHPLQLYLGIACLGLAAFLFLHSRRKRFDGQVFLLFVLLHGLIKGVLESWRFPFVGHLQMASLGAAAVAALLLLWINRSGENSPPLEG